jgi:hypothetical protein
MTKLELKRRGVCCPEPSCDHPIKCEGCGSDCQACYGEQLASKEAQYKILLSGYQQDIQIQADEIASLKAELELEQTKGKFALRISEYGEMEARAKKAEKENSDLKAELKNEQSKRGIGINQVLLDENKNLKAKIAKAEIACEKIFSGYMTNGLDDIRIDVSVSDIKALRKALTSSPAGEMSTLRPRAKNVEG